MSEFLSTKNIVAIIVLTLLASSGQAANDPTTLLGGFLGSLLFSTVLVFGVWWASNKLSEGLSRLRGTSE